MARCFARLSCVTALAAALCGVSESHAASQLQAPSGLPEDVRVQFEPRVQRTRVAGRVGSGQCFSFTLPEEWRSITGGMETRLRSALSDAELVVSLRSSHALRGLPQPDLAGRDAALLQQDYESLLGRPAQSVSLASFAPGTTRWSATWADVHLPGGAMTVEAFIVPLSEDWVLELSLSNVDAKGRHDLLVRSLLADLRVQPEPVCFGRTDF